VTPASTVGFFFAPNFIQNFYTVLKIRLWESRSTPTLTTKGLVFALLFLFLFLLPNHAKHAQVRPGTPKVAQVHPSMQFIKKTVCLKKAIIIEVEC
jgi:hypothetical protein